LGEDEKDKEEKDDISSQIISGNRSGQFNPKKVNL